jgi:hypothetical protein
MSDLEETLRGACQPLLRLLDELSKAIVVVPSHETAKAAEDTPWSKPNLSDFTEKSWADLPDDEKKRITNHYTCFGDADGDGIADTFGDEHLPHHLATKSGQGAVVLNGVEAAAGRMEQVAGASGQLDGIKAHLARHYAQFGRTPPWEQKSVSPSDLGKEGRVLSAKNEEALRSAIDAAEEAIKHVRSVLDQLEAKQEKQADPQMRPVLKVDGEGRWSVYAPILKVNAERRVVTGHVLVANTVDYQDDYVEPDEIWKAMEKYMIAFQQLDVMHSEVIDPLLRVVECYQAPVDFELGGQPVGAGDWIMSVKVMDEDVWRQVQSGELRGFSIMGRGLRVPVEELPAGVEVLASATPP